MSLILKGISSIREEWKQLTKKKIKKPKRKNQYTLSYKFVNEIKNNHQKQKDDILLIVQKIPKTIPNNNIFRLKTNIQFSLNINKDNSLGQLFIDPHSNNYKIQRIDKRKNLIILTLNQINRVITPTDVLYQIFKQRNEELAKSFLQFNNRNMDPFKMKQNSLNDMIDYERKLQGKPYACYVNIFKNNEWMTFQKILSSEMLKVLAITEEMLEHYCNETQLMPISAYFDHNDDQMNIFYKIFSGVVKQQSAKREYMNYNGEKFTANLQIKCFFIYDKEKDQMFDYQYFVTDCDQKWMSEDRIKQNELDYFNIKPNSNSTEESSYQEPLKRCGFKYIN